jgi:hypothetical protein
MCDFDDLEEDAGDDVPGVEWIVASTYLDGQIVYVTNLGGVYGLPA